MHYGGNYFAIDPNKPTLIPRDQKEKGSMGQRRGLSTLDCLKLNLLYGCFDNKKNERKYKPRCLALGADT